MTGARSHAELVTLRKLAQELAQGRKERMSTVHLIAAIAARDGQAADLLRDRRLDRDALLKATRSFDDDGPDSLGRVLASARDISKRAPATLRMGPPAAGSGANEPSALHLLLALLGDSRSAAHRALVHLGVDLGRLRASAMQLSLGIVAARRAPTTARADLEPPATKPAARLSPAAPAGARLPAGRHGSDGPGVTVSLVPSPHPTPVAASATAAAASPAASPAPARPDRARTSSPPPPATVSDVVPRGRPEPRRAPAGFRTQSAAPSSERASVESSAEAALALDRGRFPTLATLGKNLTLAAAEGRLERVVGRDAEIDQALDVLAKRRANSPCLVGPAGVGKTSVARGIAHRLAEARGAEGPRWLVEIVVSELLAGTGARGALAERVSAIVKEVRESAGEIVLFVDELHELFGGGALDEATAEVKLALARGELRLVGATSPEDYRRSVESDPALARRFTVVEIDEPEVSDAFLLVRGVAEDLGRHHGLAYADEAVASAVSWSVRYLPGRALPDKAIGVLDLAGARTRRRAAGLLGGAGGKCGGEVLVGPAEVAGVVAELADLPVERLLETDRERMLALERLLAERVVGHGAALARIAKVLRRNAAGLRGRRPIGSFLLLGPTGVGKTETAKAIAEALFHSPDAMTRLDLSEYAEAHAVARLVGAPPGYVGYEAGGQLTEAVRRRPYQVVLLDEIEKAHRDVLEAFLQVFDEGRLTDGRGRLVDFTNTVLVLTSNLGAAEGTAARGERPVGFAARAVSTGAIDTRAADATLAAARAALPPELYNRLDEVLCFAALARADVATIARKLLAALGAALEDRGVRLQIDDGVVEALLDAGGFDAELGARPMKRAIARLVEAPLAEMILRGQLERGAVAMIGVERGEILVDAVAGGKRRTAGS
jgi:ATP-dependent Clp protease ATP-binding subunit ClpC